VRTDRLAATYGLKLVWTHFPLHPETPAGGIELAELFAGRNYDVEAAQDRMERLMAAEGLAYARRTRTYNSRLAQELGKWAETQPEGQGIHDALFRAYFAEGKNIGDVDVLVEVARQLGLPVDEARKVLTERSFSPAVDRDWARSREAGVTGVPTFAAGGFGVVGAQPYEALERLVRHVGAVPVEGRGGD
jgi:predicted DsbA family dithiol-disulfide isomerase